MNDGPQCGPVKTPGIPSAISRLGNQVHGLNEMIDVLVKRLEPVTSKGNCTGAARLKEAESTKCAFEVELDFIKDGVQNAKDSLSALLDRLEV